MGHSKHNAHTKSAAPSDRDIEVEDPATLLLCLPDGPSWPLVPCMTLGRAYGNTVVLDDARVSRTHCVLFFDPLSGAVQVEDSGSKGGTRVNRRTIKSRTQVSAGQVIKIGETRLLVCGQAGAEQLPDVVGRTLIDWAREVWDVYRSFPAAQGRVGKSHQTLWRWARKGDDC